MARSKNDSYEHLMSVIQRAAWRTFDNWDNSNGEPNRDVYVLHTFKDAVVLHDSVSDKLFEATYFMNGSEVVFGELKEVEEMYVRKRFEDEGLTFDMAAKRSEIQTPEIGGPIVMKNEAQRIAYAAVLVPGEPDSDGEVVTAEKIEQVAHEWMEAYRNVDLMHTLNNVGTPVESYILPVEMEVDAYGQKTLLPKGTWILASKLAPETWELVANGSLTGYSVMGIKRSAFENAAAKSQELDQAAFKRTLLRDLGPDWVAAFVSVVDEPAVPKAKFFALKSKAHEESTEPTGNTRPPQQTGLFAKIAGALGFQQSVKNAVTAEKEGRKFSNATYELLKSAVDGLSALLAEAEAERANKSVNNNEEEVSDVDEAKLQEMITNAVKSVVDPLTTRIDELEKASKAEPDVEEPATEEVAVEETAATEEPEGAEKSEELTDDEFKAKVMKSLEDLEKKTRRLSTASKALPDDGGEGAPSEEPIDLGRDAYGRKIKKGGRK